ncbi:hypothetical protein NDU88_000957 [Pleurodeles waltl]|uniref:Uncharacterized protein n=1 Tax=Pleurodeles waltl TaxID=8319 RepID=A0AAV7KN81_PLEWA|nr:hypothetical protein NDU88_000957 [Pleurodeles waltl]
MRGTTRAQRGRGVLRGCGTVGRAGTIMKGSGNRTSGRMEAPEGGGPVRHPLRGATVLSFRGLPLGNIHVLL